MATIVTDEHAGHAPLSERAQQGAIPWYVYAVAAAGTAVVLGIMWDISWHRSIGRDTFWTPAHLLVYLGGLTAGISCAWVVLKTTLRGDAAQRARAVSFWGFRGPLGAWIVIWGALAMLTSAPFDDWWHNAYGLDVKILSPPHTLLALGIAGLQLGAIFMVLPVRNLTQRTVTPRGEWLYLWTLGVLLLTASIMISESTFWVFARRTAFYRDSAWIFPLLLTLAIASSRSRWPATTIAAIYMGVTILMMQVLQLFPAEPKLGPIYQHITHMVPPAFPLLVIIPALAMDVIARQLAKREKRNDWLLALALGSAFFILFLLVHWPFSGFMLSPGAANRIFVRDNLGYNIPPTSYTFRHVFAPSETGVAFQRGLLFGLLISIVMSRLGLAWGRWMSKVKR
jgi:hypothetical protein